MDGKIYLIALDVKVCVIEVSGPQLHAFALGVKDDVPLPDKQESRGCKGKFRTIETIWFAVLWYRHLTFIILEYHFYIYSLSMPFWGVMVFQQKTKLGLPAKLG